MFRRTLVMIVTACCGVMYAAPAQAEEPERYTDHLVEGDSIDCSTYNPNWTFHDDFVDTYDIDRTVYLNADGEPMRLIDHVEHHSDDVNSVTGFTLHEHNHFIVVFDLVNRTASFSGAENVMQRPSVGSVILYAGHKVFSFDSDEPIQFSGPATASDEDFCRAIA
jgi:hypothetical protein